MMSKPYTEADQMLRSSSLIDVLSEVASENELWVICANLAGAQESTVFEGNSMVVAPDGRVVAMADPFVSASLLVNLADGIPASMVRPLLPYEADWQAAVLGVRDYAGKCGFSDCLLGISGGIDSAVVATLAVDALGPAHVHGVLMPGPNSSVESVSDALRLAANLGIETFTLPITAAYQSFMELYEKQLGERGSDLAIQNIQARIRTIHLMHLSNTFGWLLLNTGNKSEAAMGYSTLYGDTAGAIAPLGNIYKTDVYGMAEWRNLNGAPIPEEIFTKAPSAELYPGQKDSDSLPDYPVLDSILKLHLEFGYGVDRIILGLKQMGEYTLGLENLVIEVLAKVRAAEFKRRQEPMSLKLGNEDFNEDRAWPVVNGFKERYRRISSEREMVMFLSRAFGLDARTSLNPHNN